MRFAEAALGLALGTGCVSTETAEFQAQMALYEVSNAVITDCHADLSGQARELQINAGTDNIAPFQAGYLQGLTPLDETPLDEACLSGAVARVNKVVEMGGHQCIVSGSVRSLQESRETALGVTVDCLGISQ